MLEMLADVVAGIQVRFLKNLGTYNPLSDTLHSVHTFLDQTDY